MQRQVEMIPRIMGNAIQQDDGKWGFEIIVSQLGDTEGEGFTVRASLATKQAAIDELKNFIKSLMEKMAKEDPRIDPNQYIDLFTKQRRQWQEN